MSRKDELIAERDRLVWLLSHTAAALNEGIREAMGMSYDKHITTPAMTRLSDEEGLEFAIRHLENKAAVGISLLRTEKS